MWRFGRGAGNRTTSWDAARCVTRTSFIGTDTACASRRSRRVTTPEFNQSWMWGWSAIDLYLRAAATGAVAVVAEVNPAFTSLSPSLSIWYGRETMRELALKPVLNAGVFALRAEAPHWAAWEASYREGLARRPDVWINQVALNHAVYRNDLPLHYLPSRCNWTCSNALPKVDRESSLLVEPFLPHDPIGVVHMTWDTKDGEFDLAAVDGGTVRRSLRYGGDS